MLSGVTHKTKDVNGLKTEFLFSCTVVFSEDHVEGIPAWTPWINLELTKRQFILEQNPFTRLTRAEYLEAFPQMLKTLFPPIQNPPTQKPSNMQASKTGAK